MRARAFRFASMSLLVAAAVACGSRTGLFLDEEAFGPNPIDGGPPLLDGGRRDAARDVVEIEDAIPPLDVTPPQDVNNIDCAEVFGSDTASVGLAQDLDKKTTGVPMAVEAVAARYLTNTKLAATTFEVGLTAKF